MDLSDFLDNDSDGKEWVSSAFRLKGVLHLANLM